MNSNFKFQISNYLAKLQALPEQGKKIILWVIVVFIAVVMVFFWSKGAINSLSKVGGAIQKVEIPQISTSNIVSSNNLIPVSEDNSVIKPSENKVYINSKYGFEIEYPTDWTFRDYETGAAFFPGSMAQENTTGNGAITAGFYSRGSSFCKVPFEDYVKIAGPSEIQNYESLNLIGSFVNNNNIDMFVAQWNYNDVKGVGRISLPIAYIKTNAELCGSVEIFLNDNNYSDVYSEMVYTFKFTNTK